MYKFFWPLLLIIFILISLKSSACITSEQQISDKKKPARSSKPIIKRPQGLYLDSSFLSILGNANKEDSLLKWAKANYFNKFSYYHMGKILASEMTTSLSSFIEKARTSGIEDHVAIMGGDSTFTLIQAYNNSQSFKSKFTSIQIEDEWWQSDNSIKDFYHVVDLLKEMKAWGTAQNPIVSVDLYFGRFNNIPGTDEDAADTLIKYSDRVLIAHQFDDPITNFYPKYLKNRVKKFHYAAKNANKSYPILIILYPGQAPSYYGKHSYQMAFNNFNDKKWRNYTRSKDMVQGYVVFSLTEALHFNQLKFTGRKN